ncbi:hypothetical protein HAX54_037523, partial [Datura stramonium]|nr:hypothetical protein [Datura stramonium]
GFHHQIPLFTSLIDWGGEAVATAASWAFDFALVFTNVRFTKVSMLQCTSKLLKPFRFSTYHKKLPPFAISSYGKFQLLRHRKQRPVVMAVESSSKVVSSEQLHEPIQIPVNQQLLELIVVKDRATGSSGQPHPLDQRAIVEDGSGRVGSGMEILNFGHDQSNGSFDEQRPIPSSLFKILETYFVEPTHIARVVCFHNDLYCASVGSFLGFQVMEFVRMGRHHDPFDLRTVRSKCPLVRL